jgi:hypothetical protein
MKLNWRKAEYEFNPKAYIAHPDSEKTADVHAPFFAMDTETVTDETQRCEAICFQVSNGETGAEWLEYLPTRQSALEPFLQSFTARYTDTLHNEKCVFIWCHNLLFDLGQLVKDRPDLMTILRTGSGIDQPLTLYKVPSHTAILKKGGLFEGNSPFFEIEIKFSKRDKCILKFRDTYSYFPASLDSLGKTLNLPSIKLTRPEEIGSLDYRNLHPSDSRRISFEAYALRDPLVTVLVAERIRQLHLASNIQKIRVSAPSFAIAYLLHTTKRETRFVQGVEDVPIMQLVLDAYSGGRTGGILHGRVSDLSIYDIHSSYPASMLTLPSFSDSTEYINLSPISDYSADELIELMDGQHCFMRVSGEETDTRHPALIQNINGTLTPVCGKFENVPTTGVELLLGIQSGSIINWNISEMVVLVETDSSVLLPFRDFASSAYRRKQQAEKGSAEYTSAKLVLNSSYGKLIESRSAVHIAADDIGIMVPIDSREPVKWGEMYFSDYVNLQSEHAGADYYDYIKGTLEGITETIPVAYLEWICLGALNLQKLEYGKYVIPAAAALITATSRARLCTGMRALNAVYWDTDSLFVTGLPTQCEDLANEHLAAVSAFLPSFIQPVRIGEELGDLGLEIENAHGYLAGTKRYWLTDGKEIKSAIHGMSGLKWEDRESALCLLATGSGLTYTSKPRPVTPKSATADSLGRFDSHIISPEFHLDSRLTWTLKNEQYIGNVLPWRELKYKETGEDGDED